VKPKATGQGVGKYMNSAAIEASLSGTAQKRPADSQDGNSGLLQESSSSSSSSKKLKTGKELGDFSSW